MRWGKPTKNKKRRDPRYFLTEQGDPLKGEREALKDAIAKYLTTVMGYYSYDQVVEDEKVRYNPEAFSSEEEIKKYQEDIEKRIKSIDWGYQDSIDGYGYEVIVEDPDSIHDQEWVMWVGDIEEDIYSGHTQRIEGTRLHLAGEW
jgi:hypothetical protein